MNKYPPSLKILIAQAKKLNIKFELIYNDNYDFYSRLSLGRKYIFIRNADLWRNINKMSGRFTEDKSFIKIVLANNNLTLYKPGRKYFSVLLLDNKIIGCLERGISRNNNFNKTAQQVVKELNLNLAEIIFSEQGIIGINKGDNYLDYGSEAIQKILKKIFKIK